MEFYRNVGELIGHTPLVEITQFPLPQHVRLFAKLEFYNPGGSIKDRLGKKMLRDAVESGKINPGGTVIEATAGNTGIGLALAAIQEGLNVVFCVPEHFSMEKQTLMKALGATIVHTSTEDGMVGAIQKAKELLETTSNAYYAEQFANSANPRTYYKTLGPEIWQQTDGTVDIFVAGAGTGGTFMGAAQYLKEQDSGIKTSIVEPVGSVIGGGEPGSHDTEGIGMEFLPDYMDRSLFDGIHTIPDERAFQRVGDLAKKEGLLVGSSSGAALEAALNEAETAEKETTIVTVFPDSSERYLSKNIYEEAL